MDTTTDTFEDPKPKRQRVNGPQAKHQVSMTRLCVNCKKTSCEEVEDSGEEESSGEEEEEEESSGEEEEEEESSCDEEEKPAVTSHGKMETPNIELHVTMEDPNDVEGLCLVSIVCNVILVIVAIWPVSCLCSCS
jgi:hypothetical protein